MRKKIFLYSAILILVLMLILAFENILNVQTYYLLFFQTDASTTIVVLIAGFLGFFIGFFSMLYSVEVAKEKALEEEADNFGAAPSEKIEDTGKDKKIDLPDDEPKEPREDNVKKIDTFDDDDEVLG